MASKMPEHVRPTDAEPAISKLNDYVMIAIFEMLDTEDLYKAGNVCQRWNKLAARCWASKKVLKFSGHFRQCGAKGFSFLEEPVAETDRIFEGIVRTNGGMVRSMDMSTVTNLSSMRLIADVCRNLRVLNLSSSGVTGQEVGAIGTCCKSLTDIALSGCLRVDENGFKSLLRRGENLTRIDVSYNAWLTGKSFVYIGSNVTILDVTRCAMMRELGFTHIGKLCPELAELTLDSCFGLTNRGLQEICQGCSKLWRLSICGTGELFRQLCHRGLECIGLLTNLKQLYLAYNRRINDEALYEISLGCQQIEVLDLHDCGFVGDAGLEPFLQCPNLRSLNISHLPNVTDSTLTALADGGRLEKLEVRDTSVTDEGCGAVVMQCRQLRLLDMCGNSYVTECTLHWCLQAVRWRAQGPQLVVVIGGSGIDDSCGFGHLAHPMLLINSLDLCNLPHYADDLSDYEPSLSDSDEE